MPWIQSAERHPEVRSTMELARERAKEGAPEGTTVIAEVQAGGRGRLGRAWDSPRGGLWMTTVLRPNGVDPAIITTLPLMVGVAVATALKRLGVDVGLKWPNDLILTGKKLGGILVEADSQAPGGFVLTGIGLNVRNRAVDLPTELQEVAISLSDAGNTDNLEKVTTTAISCLEETYASWLQDPSGILQTWRQRDVLKGHPVSFPLEGTICEGRADGIEADGSLRVIADGVTQIIRAGDVQRINT